MVDPLQVSNSNYTYVNNNPIVFIDPNGMDDYYYDQSGNQMDHVEIGFWSFDWLLGDNHYIQWDDGNINHIGTSCVITNSELTIKEHSWNNVCGLGDEELTRRVGAGIINSRYDNFKDGSLAGKKSILEYVYSESPTRNLMDYKNQGLERNIFFVISITAYNWNETGNFMWGAGMQSLGVGYTNTRDYAHLGSLYLNYSLEELHDHRAVTRGWTWGNTGFKL